MKYLAGLAASLFLVSLTWAASPAVRTPANQLLAQAPKAAWLAEGKNERIVYVFFDPNCAGCHFLYQSLRPLIRAGEVQVRWIPVAVVDDTSVGKAAAILKAADPLSALAYNEDHYQPENGGIEEEFPDDATEQRLRANTRILSELPIPVVPTMIFADANGNAILIQGALSPLALRKVFARLPGAH